MGRFRASGLGGVCQESVMTHTTQSTGTQAQRASDGFRPAGYYTWSDEQRLAYLRQHFAQYHRLTPREVRAFRRGIWWQQRFWSRLPCQAVITYGLAFGLWVASMLYSIWVRW